MTGTEDSPFVLSLLKYDGGKTCSEPEICNIFDERQGLVRCSCQYIVTKSFSQLR
jgi:hypothetical protein